MLSPDQFEGPYRLYQSRIATGHLEPDAAQDIAARRFQDLFEALSEKRLARKSSALGWMFARNKAPAAPRGLYIWGDVGRGKTMLMDLFFETVPNVRKARVHFHEFMSDVHERIHARRQALKEGSVKGEDPIPPVAAAIAEETRLLCFDEFQVTDIADAMILGRLFTRLFDAGVTVVATSNVAPDDLYHNGLNRQLFIPFIGLLKAHADVVHLDARMDFRLDKLAGTPVYHTPLGAEADAALDTAFTRLTVGERAVPMTLPLKGRAVSVPAAALGVARFTFDDLCRQPLGAADFLKIAHHFHTVIVDRIPKLRPVERNEARRFVWLIDALYDNAVKLIASAAAEPDDLYPEGDTAFEFKRTASRLIEMRSLDYLALPHGGIHAPDGPPATGAAPAGDRDSTVASPPLPESP
ncbi:MAG: AFG1 family ATPase [Rhodobiaceae bacterium]|nr:AFG1 family ATPase [Rhodobiaceae bacterium]